MLDKKNTKKKYTQLIEAIEEHDFKKFISLLQEGICLKTFCYETYCDNALIVAADEAFEIKSLKYVKTLLDYGADVNEAVDLCAKGELCNTVLNHIAGNDYIELTRLLLSYGADVNILDEENSTPLFEAMRSNDFKAAKLFIEFGAYATINKNSVGVPCFCTILGSCSTDSAKAMLLIENGADTSVKDIDDMIALEIMERHKATIKNHEDYLTLKSLLNPNNPPYLKLGETEASRYIIYENRKTEDNTYEMYLLADKQKHPDKKYLYADNKIDAFVYWCSTKSLLNDPTMKALKKYVSFVGADTYTHLSNLVKDLTGGQLTTEYFNEAGKAFATHYLTVTHWWYNLHTDFNRLYQDEDVKLPRAIKSQEEFDTLMKLLDIRYEQYQSGKHFNANQNKAELQALIEGRELPKREVDLSALLGNDEKDTLPEDFMK